MHRFLSCLPFGDPRTELKLGFVTETKLSEPHLGIDYGLDAEHGPLRIYAANSGYAIQGWSSRLGYYVSIMSLGGLCKAVYGHLQTVPSTIVRAQAVADNAEPPTILEVGTYIGLGSTHGSRLKDNRLHFEVWVKGNRINPYGFWESANPKHYPKPGSQLSHLRTHCWVRDDPPLIQL